MNKAEEFAIEMARQSILRAMGEVNAAFIYVPDAYSCEVDSVSDSLQYAYNKVGAIADLMNGKTPDDL